MHPSTTWPRRLLLAALAAALALTALGPVAHAQQAAPSTDRSPALASATRISTKTLLGQLAVRSETPAGYARSKFTLWIDADHDGCSTRAEVLLAEAVKRPTRGSGCRLTGGRWYSKYDSRTFSSAGSLDIDHLVPLNEAWQSGAKRWTSGTRKAYANDLGYGASLIAVSASSNRSKGDKEPQSWLPPTRSYRCTYVRNWVAVKWRWHLAVNASEKSYLSKKLASCGWPTVAKPSRPTIHRTTTSTGGTSSTATVFANCTDMHAVHKHGVGKPGAVDHTSGTPVTNFYVSTALYTANAGSDRDKDGIACEA